MEDFTIDIKEEKIYNTEGKNADAETAKKAKVSEEVVKAEETDVFEPEGDTLSEKIRNINIYFPMEYGARNSVIERYYKIQKRNIEEIMNDVFAKLEAYLTEEEERKRSKKGLKKEILCFYDAADAANAYPKKNYSLIYSFKKHLKKEEIIAAGNKYYDLSLFEKLSHARSSVAIKPTMKDGLFCHTLPEEVLTENKQKKSDHKKNKRF